MIDVSGDDLPTLTLASYDRTALVIVTRKSFSNRSGHLLSQRGAMLGLSFNATQSGFRAGRLCPVGETGRICLLL